MRIFLPAMLSVLIVHVAAAQQTRPSDAKAPRIGIERFDQMRHDRDTVVLDVRTAAEFNRGHVPGAMNLDISDPQFRKKAAELDRSEVYLVHCARGVRSDRAVRILSTLGFERLFDYHGGFDEWSRAGKPVEKSSPPAK